MILRQRLVALRDGHVALGDRGATLRARRRQHHLQRGDIGWKLIRALAHATHGIRFAPRCDPQSTA